MRRIMSACLLQTMRFDTTKMANPEQDFVLYCHKLDKENVKYVVEDKKIESDGSLIVKIKKQYNAYQTNGYID